VAQQCELAEHVAAAQDSDHPLRRPLIDDLETAADHDEDAVGVVAVAHDPVPGANVNADDLAGEVLEQVVGQAGQDAHVAQQAGGPHHHEATSGAPTRSPRAAPHVAPHVEHTITGKSYPAGRAPAGTSPGSMRLP